MVSNLPLMGSEAYDTINMMKIIDTTLLEMVSAQAKASSRLRMNHLRFMVQG